MKMIKASSTIAGKLETTKTQLQMMPVFVIVSDSPYSRKFSKIFGGKNAIKRSFQTAWFERFKWLHYDERRDAACCHTCLKALQSGMLISSNADAVFTKNGFSNWKNAMEKKKAFQKHESFHTHMEAVARYVTAPAYW